MSSSTTPPTEDVFVLILRMLEADPRLSTAFDALRADAEAAGLLGSRIDWTGARRPASYAHAAHRLGAPPDAAQLSQLLSRVVDFSSAREPTASRLPSAAWSPVSYTHLTLPTKRIV